MASWAFGLLLIVVGLGWVALRATLGKKSLEGSWWSHLILELSVIDRIPVIGTVWRLLPLLLVAGGVLWMFGFRPPGIKPPPPDRSPLCGVASSRPAGVDAVAWSAYECRSKAEVGERWDLCVPRSAYTTNPGRGCPGLERCCPAPGAAAPSP
jgi:hypothetical protein